MDMPLWRCLKGFISKKLFLRERLSTRVFLSASEAILENCVVDVREVALRRYHQGCVMGDVSKYMSIRKCY